MKKLSIKKSGSFILTSAIMLSACLPLCGCGGAKASPIEDFEYIFKDGEALITGYIGTNLEIVIPDTIEGRPVTCIDYNYEDEHGAFKDYDMTSIVIPDTVKYINDCAFDDCVMLENISLSDNFEYFYHGVYSRDNISSGDGYYALSDTKWYDNQEDGILYIDNILIGIKGEFTDKEIEIKNGTKCITSDVFRNNENITGVTLPNSLTYIGERAFKECTNLREINIPNTVTYIGKDAFDGCSKLGLIELPDDVIVGNNNLKYKGNFIVESAIEKW